jgi:hypothetical protein
MGASGLSEPGHRQEKCVCKALGPLALALAVTGSPAFRGEAATAGSNAPQDVSSSSYQGVAPSDTEAQKSDTPAAKSPTVLAGANRERPESLDASVESLLSRMAQAGSAPVIASMGNARSPAESSPAVSTESASVDSLLARMAAVNAAGKSRATPSEPAAELKSSPVTPTPPEPKAPNLVAPSTDAPLHRNSTSPLIAATPGPSSAAPEAPAPAPVEALTTRRAPAVPALMLAKTAAVAEPPSGLAPASDIPEPPSVSLTKPPTTAAQPQVSRTVTNVPAKPAAASVALAATQPARPNTPKPPAEASRWTQLKSYFTWNQSAKASPAPEPPAPAPANVAKPVSPASPPTPIKSLTAAPPPAELAAAPASSSNQTFTARLMSKVSSASSLLTHLRGAASDSSTTNTTADAAQAEALAVASATPNGEPRPVPTVNPALANKLHLSAVAAFGRRRGASINDRTVFQGEDAEFMVDGVRIKVRCLEIRQSSAILQVAGATTTTELRMPSAKD